MKRFFIFFVFHFLLLFCLVGNANSTNTSNKIIDSLLIELKIAKDTSKVNTLNLLSNKYTSISDFGNALKYATEAKQKSEDIDYKKGIGTAILNIVQQNGIHLILRMRLFILMSLWKFTNK